MQASPAAAKRCVPAGSLARTLTEDPSSFRSASRHVLPKSPEVRMPMPLPYANIVAFDPAPAIETLVGISGRFPPEGSHREPKSDE